MLARRQNNPGPTGHARSIGRREPVRRYRLGRRTIPTNLAPTSWPNRQTTLHVLASAPESSTNSSGTSKPSTLSRRPLSEMSIIRRSRRVSPPSPIFAER